MSFRDIGVILNKVIEEKKTEGWKEEQQDDAEKNQEQQRHLSLSTEVFI